jgi:hypothetical protein
LLEAFNAFEKMAKYILVSSSLLLTIVIY